MATNLQIRSVDERLAEAAKARAAATHRSLSDYVKDLIVRDLAAQDSRSRMCAVLDEVAADPEPAVDRADTAAALAQVRQEMGTA